MNILELNLAEDELKKIKKDFNNGQVYTDGCFCGHAMSNFRDNLYVVISFSCRKSMNCDNPHYQVIGLGIYEKASNLYSKERLDDLLKVIDDDDFDVEINSIEGRKLIFANDYYSDATSEDIYLSCDGLKLDKESSKAVQKRLFKYYKNTYGEYSEAKFKDVGLLEN